MTEPIEIHEYENGLALVTQRMDWVESAAFSLLVPAGCARDPRPLLGLGNHHVRDGAAGLWSARQPAVRQ